MDVYLDSGPEQGFIVISVEGDSENITLGFQPAGKLLFSSVNREIKSCTHSGGKKGLFLDAGFERWNQQVVSGFYQFKCLAYEKVTTVDIHADPKSDLDLTLFVLDGCLLPITGGRLYHRSENWSNFKF